MYCRVYTIYYILYTIHYILYTIYYILYTIYYILSTGGSYPGNLAAWFRLKYPSVTHASIASSAPLHAQTNFPEYMEVCGVCI